VVLGDGDFEVSAITENFSSDGVLLYADQFIQEGTEVGLILALPTETEAEGKRVWCFGKVLRVEKELKASSAWLLHFSVANYCPTFVPMQGSAVT
jgi:hypothetical protein